MKSVFRKMSVSLILAAGAAAAHTELTTSLPANGAVLTMAPEDVQLTFSEPVRLTALSIQKDGDRKQSLGPLPSESVEHFTVALPEQIGSGHYVVTWRALSADTHVMTGEFMFAVGAEAAHGAQMNHAEMPAEGHHAMPAGEHHAMPADQRDEQHGGAH